MTMAALIALGAPRLPYGRFYRIRSNSDGMVFVQIRRSVEPSWRTLWRSSRLVVEVLCDRAVDPHDDIREGCEKAVDAIAQRIQRWGYWDTVRSLEGDHR